MKRVPEPGYSLVSPGWMYTVGKQHDENPGCWVDSQGGSGKASMSKGGVREKVTHKTSRRSAQGKTQTSPFGLIRRMVGCGEA